MSTYADVELELGLDSDVPLPFGDRVEELTPEQEVTRLRRALVDCLAHVEAGTVPHASVSAATGARPTITAVARRKVEAWSAGVMPGRNLEGLDLTTADVWAELGPGFPVTKGIAGRMLAAKGAGLITNTGRTIIAPRDATGPNHGQRLTVWRAV